MVETFKDDRIEREKLGVLYRNLSQRFENQVSIYYVDPRNLVVIGIYFLRKVKEGKISLREAYKGLLKVKREAIFVDGEYIDDPDQCETVIEKRLKAANTNDRR